MAVSVGSFWGIEASFGRVNGVVKTATGYCGGTVRKPSHREVLEGIKGHTEAVKVVHDTQQIYYQSLCDEFWKIHDPTKREYLNFEVGTHYRSIIFYASEEQRKQAQKSKIRRQMKLNERIVTKIISLDYSDFFLAENQHEKILALGGEAAVDELERFLRSAELPEQTQFVCEEIIEDMGGNEAQGNTKLKFRELGLAKG